LIQILDYGAGNLFSVREAVKKVSPETKVKVSPRYIGSAVDGLILPGVGNFGSTQNVLRECKSEILKDVESGMPVLGICLGMQLMFEDSEEGEGSGLGLFPGKVIRFRRKRGVKVPHMGWNRVELVSRSSKLARELKSGGWAYFAHSYYPAPTDSKIILAETLFGGVTFPSIVQKKNITGTQYHPEKSGVFGAALISNFAKATDLFGRGKL
jgi:imidazole glycerol-phosphate synthase subunit HisH